MDKIIDTLLRQKPLIKVLFLLVLIVAIVGLYWQFFYRPVQAEIKAIEPELNQLKAELAAKKEIVKEKDRYIAELEQTRAKLYMHDMMELRDVVDAFGVGTQISSASTLDFSMDVVAIDGEPHAKRGKHSGRKDVLRCMDCMKDTVVPSGSQSACECSGNTVSMLERVIENGEVVMTIPSARQIRTRSLGDVSRLRHDQPVREFLGL